MTARKQNHTLRTARESADAGDTRYYTGAACCNGHVAERMVRNGVCVECLRVRRQCERRDPAKAAAADKRYREANLVLLRERDRLGKRRLRAVNPDAERARVVRFNEKRETQRAAEAGRPRASACEICSDPTRTVFDHCHASGRFRGWLCDRCNRTLGQVKDDPELLRKLAQYLEKHHVQADRKAA